VHTKMFSVNLDAHQGYLVQTIVYTSTFGLWYDAHQNAKNFRCAESRYNKTFNVHWHHTPI
jgi:hypothetical protein